ncbi:heme-degrading monooxygenase HmoA [Ureibacillus xyleni]|uniref:Heme-degrading monooxygenase HmoA n=1 Tax=Ureibacillus xyleni TaxID=614648 RepID=A0A285TAS7_9BACL|nr:antibiotic biosynthesis monooxygenase family protein [Ureibacillus xyleni]SOC16853.1 heme-degrading monooxygenase HmoA [Ureibacillus xyleni]
MFLYLTSGTPDFMEKVRKKHSKEHMIVLHGSGNSLLLHETERKTKFATPRKFEVIDQLNSLEQKGYFVLNNIPVTDEGRPIFEKIFLNRASAFTQEPGFIAYRLLRPIKSDIYIVLTQWTGPHSFEAWKNTKKFTEAYSKQDATPGVEKQNIFNAASYITTYSGKLLDEN